MINKNNPRLALLSYILHVFFLWKIKTKNPPPSPKKTHKIDSAIVLGYMDMGFFLPLKIQLSKVKTIYLKNYFMFKIPKNIFFLKNDNKNCHKNTNQNRGKTTTKTLLWYSVWPQLLGSCFCFCFVYSNSKIQKSNLLANPQKYKDNK